MVKIWQFSIHPPNILLIFYAFMNYSHIIFQVIRGEISSSQSEIERNRS